LLVTVSFVIKISCKHAWLTFQNSKDNWNILVESETRVSVEEVTLPSPFPSVIWLCLF